MTATDVRPFAIDVPQATLGDLHARLERTRWAAPAGDEYGFPLLRLSKLVDAYNTLHSQQPQTLAHALSDSPAGLLAWNGQLFDDALDDDFVLTNVALYWLTDTAGSSIRFYHENARAPQATAPTTVPVALAADIRAFFSNLP